MKAENHNRFFGIGRRDALLLLPMRAKHVCTTQDDHDAYYAGYKLGKDFNALLKLQIEAEERKKAL